MKSSESAQPTRRLLAGAALTGLLLAACGSGSNTADSTAAGGATSTGEATIAEASGDDGGSAAAQEEARLPLPAVNVFDVGSGSEVSLTSLSDDGRPTLLWFYAPH